MRIAFIHPRYPESDGTGASHSATQIVGSLSDRGHDVTVYCTEKPSEDTTDAFDTRYLDGSGYPGHPDLQTNSALQSRINEFGDFDILHSYLMSTIPAIASISRSSSVNSVVTLNAYGGICPKNDLRYLDKRECHSNGLLKCMYCSSLTSGGHDKHGRLKRTAYRVGRLELIRRAEKSHSDIDHFHALSPHIKETYGRFGYDAENITVVPNMLDERFLVENEADFRGPYRMLYVGYLHGHKGVDKLVPILKGLRDTSDKEFELTIVGDGARFSKIAQQAKEFGVEDKLIQKGHVEYSRLPSIYAEHDLFIYPGEWDEPFGRVFLEALATGTPVISSNVGSVDSIIGDAGIVTDGTIDSFVTAILNTTEQTSLLRMSENCDREIKRYEREKLVDQFESIYSEIES